MSIVAGIALVFVAGVFQGTFMLPMTLTRHWSWEHSWGAFSLLGMLLFNWLLAMCVIPGLPAVYRDAPSADLLMLLFFGGCWGAGALLFGLGMKRLGMALGYPVIMGLILCLGALIPLLLRNPASLATQPGLLLLAATGVTLLGIVLCSQAAAWTELPIEPGTVKQTSQLLAGLTVAVPAGVLSCFPNVGMNFADHLKLAACKYGASEAMAGNAAWAIFFTAGFVVNFGYCLGLMLFRGNAKGFAEDFLRNVALVAAMALLWIGSFYLYGIGAACLGRWGGIVGWPLFISLAIIVGNLWGLARGEWADAPISARRRLNLGLAILLGAVALFAVSSMLTW